MLLPYLPSLLAWGFSDAEIADLFAEIAEACSGIQLLQIHLTGSAKLCLPRAIDREEPSWLDWMIAKVAQYEDVGAPVTDLASLIQYFDSADRRTSKLLADTPWPVVVIDADRGQEQAIADASEAAKAILCRAQAT